MVWTARVHLQTDDADPRLRAPMVDGYRELACAVLHAAVHDAGAGSDRCASWARALVFITKRSPLLDLWCGVAGMNTDAFVDRARVKFKRRLLLMTEARAA